MLHKLKSLPFTTPTRPGPRRPHKLLVFINPFGGKKKGRKIYHSLVAPLFELAGISSHVIGMRHKSCEDAPSDSLKMFIMSVA